MSNQHSRGIFLVLLVALFFFSSKIEASIGFNELIPNGNMVSCPSDAVGCLANNTCVSLGHMIGSQQYCGDNNTLVGEQPRPASLNSFANFNRFNWTASCIEDSDGDGVTNGAELGDPACIWQVGSTAPLYPMNVLTHPGDANHKDNTLIGNGCFRIDYDGTTPGNPPAKVAGLRATPRPTSIDLKWNRYALTTPCVFQYELTAEWETLDENNQTVANLNRTSTRVTNYDSVFSFTFAALPLSTSITIRIQAVNEYGKSEVVPITVNTTASNAPGVPLGFTVVPSGLTASVSWTPPVDTGGLNVTYYHVMFRNATQSVIASVPGNQTNLVYDSLAVARTYHAKMWAENEEGNGTQTSYFTFSTSLRASSSTISFLPVLLLLAILSIIF